MKKLILLALLVFSLNTYAQEAHIAGLFDVRNATFGSNATNNKRAFDGMAKCYIITESNFKWEVKYETFKEIGFKRYGLLAGGKRFETKLFGETFFIAPTIGVSMIKRNWDYYRKSFIINPEVSLPINYQISDKWGVEAYSEFLYRGDLNERYGDRTIYTKDDVKFSFMIGFTYKISK